MCGCSGAKCAFLHLHLLVHRPRVTVALNLKENQELFVGSACGKVLRTDTPHDRLIFCVYMNYYIRAAYTITRLCKHRLQVIITHRNSRTSFEWQHNMIYRRCRSLCQKQEAISNDRAPRTRECSVSMLIFHSLYLSAHVRLGTEELFSVLNCAHAPHSTIHAFSIKNGG